MHKLLIVNLIQKIVISILQYFGKFLPINYN